MQPDELYDRYLRDELTAPEAAELAGLLRADPHAREELVRHTSEAVLILRVGAQLKQANNFVSEAGLSTVPSKNIPLWAWLSAAALVAIGLIAGLYFHVEQPGHILARVSNVAGDATIARGSVEQRVKLHDPVSENDTVTTASNGHVTLAYEDDGTSVRCAASSRFQVHLEGGNKRVRLERGTLMFSVNPQREGRTLAVQTPFADIQVVGTVFSVEVGSDATRVDVTSGEVRVEHRLGNSSVSAGNCVVIDETGLKPWRKVVDLDFARGDKLPDSLKPFFVTLADLENPSRVLSDSATAAVLKDGWLEMTGHAKADNSPTGVGGVEWREKMDGDISIDIQTSHTDGAQVGVSVGGGLLTGYRVVFNFGEGRWTGVQLDRIPSDGQRLLAHSREKITDAGAPHHLRIEKSGTQIRAWVDGVKRIDESVQTLPDAKNSFSLFSVFTNSKVSALRVMTR